MRAKHNILRFAPASIVAFSVALSASLAVAAADGKDIVERCRNSCASFICIAPDSGAVVSEMNADATRAPASMVKMVLMLMVAEGLEEGKWTLAREIEISRKVERVSGAQIYLKKGEKLTLERLIQSVAVLSANDAAMAVAEDLWGSEKDYLKAANKRVKELGLANTTLRTVHGLTPASGDPDETTARDMSTLARVCVAKPQVMKWVAVKEYSPRPGVNAKSNTNKLLDSMPGCDGLKTGYTDAAGYCFSGTAVRGDVRLIVVVMGCERLNDRFTVAQGILEDGFTKVQRVRILEKGRPLLATLSVDNCTTRQVTLSATEDVWSTLPKGDIDKLDLVTHHPKRVCAPVAAGKKLGQVEVRLDGRVLASAGLAVPRDLNVPDWKCKLEHAVLDRLVPAQQ